MNESNNVYETKFGQLILGDGPENDFYWTGYISNTFFSSKIPVYVFTKNSNISSQTIDFMQTIVSDIDRYLETAILFIKQTLSEQKEKYNIRENEYEFLNLEVKLFPVDLPELTFWEDSIEWMIRFAEGNFYICDPLGIGVTFKFDQPISVDNLEDSELI
nr:hypothetical protein [Flavobacterium sp. ASV13]